MPPHRSGPTFAKSSASGKGRTQGHWARTRSASRHGAQQWFPEQWRTGVGHRKHIRGIRDSYERTSQVRRAVRFLAPSSPRPVPQPSRSPHVQARTVLGHAPFVVEHRKIRVAESTVRYFDFDLFRTKLAGVETEQFQRPFGRKAHRL